MPTHQSNSTKRHRQKLRQLPRVIFIFYMCICFQSNRVFSQTLSIHSNAKSEKINNQRNLANYVALPPPSFFLFQFFYLCHSLFQSFTCLVEPWLYSAIKWNMGHIRMNEHSYLTSIYIKFIVCFLFLFTFFWRFYFFWMNFLQI